MASTSSQQKQQHGGRPVVVVVTGASRGIGLELVRQLLQRAPPSIVIATARNPPASPGLTELAKRFPAAGKSGTSILHLVPLDVTSDASLRAGYEAVAKLQPDGIDVLINNAGLGDFEPASAGTQPSTSLAKVTRTQLTTVLDTNTAGPILTTQAFLPLLLKGGRKLVGTVSSFLGSIANNSSGDNISYRVSKAAVNMAMVTLAREHASQGFTFLILHPGWVATDMGNSGGKTAPLSVQDSAAGLIKVLDAAKQSSHNGHFIDYTGKELPW